MIVDLEKELKKRKRTQEWGHWDYAYGPVDLNSTSDEFIALLVSAFGSIHKALDYVPTYTIEDRLGEKSAVRSDGCFLTFRQLCYFEAHHCLYTENGRYSLMNLSPKSAKIDVSEIIATQDEYINAKLRVEDRLAELTSFFRDNYHRAERWMNTFKGEFPEGKVGRIWVDDTGPEVQVCFELKSSWNTRVCNVPLYIFAQDENGFVADQVLVAHRHGKH